MSGLLSLPRAGHYEAILADPPWQFRNYNDLDKAHSPERHYRTMTIDEIKALPVGRVAAPEAWLFLWATWPTLPWALEVIEAWGFTYKTGGSWGKRSSRDRTWQFGTGYLFRSASEPYLVASRGRPPWLSRRERNLIVAPVREHSRKPDEMRAMIERATRGPRLELFANEDAPGWDRWGMGHARG